MYLEHSVGGAEAPTALGARWDWSAALPIRESDATGGRDERRVIFWKGKKNNRKTGAWS